MKHWSRFAREIAFLIAACVCASQLLALQEGGEKPKPAAREYSPLLNTDNQQDADQGTQTMKPDNQPLSGVLNPTLGTPEMRHSYWVPGIEYGNTVRSNPVSPASNSVWDTSSFVSGNVSLLEAWSHSQLSADYSGGGFFSTDPTQGNGQYHQLGTTYEIDLRRLQILFVEQFSYLPQSTFGF